MKLSELYGELNAVPDVHEFSLALAEPDRVEGDTVDVQLVPVGRVDLLYDSREARIFPIVPGETMDEAFAVLGMLLQRLPLEALDESDLRLTVELPLDRENAGLVDRQVVEIEAVHIGVASEEVWLLVRPIEEYGQGVLPE